MLAFIAAHLAETLKQAINKLLLWLIFRTHPDWSIQGIVFLRVKTEVFSVIVLLNLTLSRLDS